MSETGGAPIHLPAPRATPVPPFAGWGVGGRAHSVSHEHALATLTLQSFFHDLDAQLQQALCETAVHVKHGAGTVIFQQGDLPGGTYVILAGRVGMFRRPELAPLKEEVVTDGGDATSTAAVFALKPLPLGMLQTSDSIVCSTAREFGVASDADDFACANVFRCPWTVDDWELSGLAMTAEGFSVYRSRQDFGVKLQTLGPEASFGEDALLMPAESRSTTAVCLEDCLLFAINGALSKQHILSAEEALSDARKLDFLRVHLPGISNQPIPNNMPGGRTHPMHFFTQAYFPKGHRFMKQGVAVEDAIYVIIEGAVEIRYKQQEQWLDFAKQLPTCREALQVQRARREGRQPAHSCPPASRRRGLFGRSKDEQIVVSEESSYLVSTLRAGGVFGSLLPFAGTVEPFSAVASMSCQVYCATGVDVNKLPLTLLEVLREYLASSTKWRLERLRNDRKSRAG